MASTSSEDDEHTTAAMATTAVPDSDTTPALQGLPLTDYWSLGERELRYKQKHATVFLVNDKSGRSVRGIEAYAYVLDKTEPKVRAHRLRNINRMEKRTMLEVRVQDTVIIVVSTSQAPENRASENAGTADKPVAVKGGHKSNAKLRCKDPHKREMARTRQRERRQAKRSAKAEQQSNATDDEQERTLRSIVYYTKKPFTGFILSLFKLYHGPGTNSGEIPFDHHDLIEMLGGYSLCESIERFINQGPSKVESLADVESCLKAKRAERMALQRHLAMIPGANDYHWDKLRSIRRKQYQHREDWAEWARLTDGPVDHARLQWLIVGDVESNLLSVVAAQKAQLRSIEKMRSRFLKESASGEERTHTVFLEPYADQDIQRKVEEAKRDLAALDRGLSRASTTHLA